MKWTGVSVCVCVCVFVCVCVRTRMRVREKKGNARTQVCEEWDNDIYVAHQTQYVESEQLCLK